MRIIHIHLGIKGGAERFLVHLVHGLADRGAEQMVLTFPDRAWRPDLEPVCQVHEFNFSRSRLKRPYFNWRIRHLVRTFRPQAIMSWMPQASRWVPSARGVLTAARLGDYPEKLDYFANCKRLVCNTPDIARHCAALGWPEDRVQVISNFTDTRRAAPADRAALATPQDAFVIVALGRMVARKGFATLIRALARVDGAVLWLIGEGEQYDEMERLAETLGVRERIRMPGWVSDPAAYIAAADVLCCPSEHEPLGNVVLEAWAQERAVAATASEGPSWLVEPGRTGLLAPVGDAEGLAAALARLRDQPDLRRTLAAAGRAKLEAQFSKAAICDAYMRFFAGEQAEHGG